MNSHANAIADVNGYFTQMGGSSRSQAAQAGPSHVHFRPNDRSQSSFDPPTAPAAMRAGFIAGNARRGGQYSTMVGNDIQRRVGGHGLVRTAGLPDGWYR